jgi:very-short-patch-repair endonuclease
MALRVSLAQAKKLGWVSDSDRLPSGAQSSKSVNTAEGTPQHILFTTLKNRHPEIPIEWEKKHLIPGRKFETDLFIPDRLVIEVDGYRYHRSNSAFKKDRDRQNLFTLHGFKVLRFYAKQIFDDRQLEEAIELIATVYEEMSS